MTDLMKGEINNIYLAVHIIKMKILVPTDFSDTANNAAKYAVKLTAHLSAEIILFHVLNRQSIHNIRTPGKNNSSEKDLFYASEMELDLLINSLKRNNGQTNFRKVIVKGNSMAKTAACFAEKNKLDLIVCGTKGAQGIAKSIFGSNAAAMIAESNVPVLVVPGRAKFSALKKIVYASDLRAIKSEIALLILFARLFGAGIDILHITRDSSKLDAGDLLAQISEKNKFEKLDLHIQESSGIPQAIDKYISHARAGMLAMFTHKPGMLEALFGKSVTRELSFHSRIPLLTMKR